MLGPIAAPERVKPFLILPAALICLTCGGGIYWWPAVNPGVTRALSLSSNQADLVIATVGSGSTVGILGGLFHSRYGTRLTAILSAIGLASVYACFSLLTVARPLFLGPLLFPLTIVLSLLLVTCSFLIYSTSMALAAAVMPPRFRGRVVGLCASAFGGSAGVLTALQSAYFPRLDDTSPLLLFVAVLCFIPATMAYLIFPRAERFDPMSMTAAPEDMPLVDSDAADNSMTGYVARMLRKAYIIAWVYVAVLQAAALSDIFGVSPLAKIFISLVVVFSLGSFWLLNMHSSLRVCAKDNDTSMDELLPAGVDAEEDPTLKGVVLDSRFLYMALQSFVLVAGGGVMLLVQARNIVLACGFATEAGEVAAWVRTIVATFAACNVTARLFIGSVMDMGTTAQAQHLWKFRILHTNTLAMAVGLLLIAARARAAVLVGVMLVGASYGMFFAVAPTLTTVWFGLRNFPRNFAVIGPFIASGSLTVASSVPIWLRSKFGSWVERGVGEEAICVGTKCIAPVVTILAGLQVLTFAVGMLVWPRVRRGAEV